jgi:hypothetical protein
MNIKALEVYYIFAPCSEREIEMYLLYPIQRFIWALEILKLHFQLFSSHTKRQ